MDGNRKINVKVKESQYREQRGAGKQTQEEKREKQTKKKMDGERKINVICKRERNQEQRGKRSRKANI